MVRLLPGSAFAVFVTLVILSAGVAAIYLILKNMSEEGIDIAEPGSCKRGRRAVPTLRKPRKLRFRLRILVIRVKRIPEGPLSLKAG